MRILLRAIGYDPEIVDGLSKGHQRFFAAAAIASLLAAIVVGVGTGYGGVLTLGAIVGGVLAVAGFLFLVNLLRLHHAGSGYPLHLPIEDIGRWSPAGAASVVLFLFGTLLAQPVAFLVLKPRLDAQVAAHVAEERAIRAQLGVDSARPPADGLILRANVAWKEPVPTGAIVVFFAMLVALPALMRRFGASAVRTYESERWIRERMFVDDEFATAQDDITNMLAPVPGFSGTLQVHYADPPYNTIPLVYGLDPSILIEGGVKFVRPSKVDGNAVIMPPTETPLPPPGPEPVAEPVPPPVVAKPPEPPPAPPQPLPPRAPIEGEDIAPDLNWDDDRDDARTEPPAAAFFDVGRAQVKRAREHADFTAPLIARYTGRPESEVRALLKNATDDARLHRVFPEWKKLPTILLKDAGFATDFQLAPVLSIIVERPVADVERRLRAAPREKRLSGVFAPELARRLLNKKVKGA